MFLSILNVTNFRNLENANLDFSNHYNIFCGENGSGKTSILEAIYYLALGRSFRSHILRRIIKYEADSFSLFGKIKQHNSFIPIGIDRSIVDGKHVKIAGEVASSHTEITKLFPLQLLNHDSYRFINDGPKIRRQFIDWGLFHVEQDFLNLWRKVEKIISQRNAAIVTNSKIDSIKIWNNELSKYGLELHKRRKKYIENLIPITQEILQKLLPDFSIKISYFAGWNTESDLERILEENIKNDLKFGYTIVGPQRADLQLTINNVSIKDALSRGQQKLLLYGLQISQGILLNRLTNKNCVYLVDDLAAELDLQKRSAIASVLLDLQSQVFITGLSHDKLGKIFSSVDMKMFHVEHGCITT